MDLNFRWLTYNDIIILPTMKKKKEISFIGTGKVNEQKSHVERDKKLIKKY